MSSAGPRHEAGFALGALSADELRLVTGLRSREEAAFVELVERYRPSLLRLALTFVRTPAVAEEVVQETWLGVLNGIDRFEGRSSLGTWIFRILTNRAKTRGEREARSVPFSALAAAEELEGPSVDPARFRGRDELFYGHWSSPPRPWTDVPQERLLARETRERIAAAIKDLPPAQREVITLRDVEGWSSEEVCNALGLSETNQRVILHRARAKVRQSLAEYLTDE
jgi:RNA polymerase sigma-70 factor (ECF subfamily)